MYQYEELQEMVQRWLDANRLAEEKQDWSGLADLYTEDASYGWNVGPNDEFMAVGREEIRSLAFAQEMEGFQGWNYPYQKVLIDEHQGEVIGLWKQIAPTSRADGSPYEIAGIGGSWFRYGGDWQWSWQRDFFDLGNATALFIEMMQANDLPPASQQRIEKAMKGGRQPGHYRIGTAPADLWT